MFFGKKHVLDLWGNSVFFMQKSHDVTDRQQQPFWLQKVNFLRRALPTSYFCSANTCFSFSFCKKKYRSEINVIYCKSNNRILLLRYLHIFIKKRIYSLFACVRKVATTEKCIQKYAPNPQIYKVSLLVYSCWKQDFLHSSSLLATSVTQHAKNLVVIVFLC